MIYVDRAVSAVTCTYVNPYFASVHVMYMCICIQKWNNKKMGSIFPVICIVIQHSASYTYMGFDLVSQPAYVHTYVLAQTTHVNVSLPLVSIEIVRML